MAVEQRSLGNAQVFAFLADAKQPVSLRVLDIAFVDRSRGLRVSSLVFTNRSGRLVAKNCLREVCLMDLIKRFVQDGSSTNGSQPEGSLGPDV